MFNLENIVPHLSTAGYFNIFYNKAHPNSENQSF